MQNVLSYQHTEQVHSQKRSGGPLPSSYAWLTIRIYLTLTMFAFIVIHRYFCYTSFNLIFGDGMIW